ncbi:MAG: hypothetical protein G3M78_02830 [Candidatus Nitrohelix vancouverensis]|uniref:NB-ARC domain-containing protein n=1 Tax=Candidatus Nitrohelix vancouverensis TaxID=2705534 RepID=A0A7T0C0R6_9BACT|nr:MAG: hypothetical protein G3M78_02830 [Candidatus Nitrohelix vancouverensis]
MTSTVLIVLLALVGLGAYKAFSSSVRGSSKTASSADSGGDGDGESGSKSAKNSLMKFVEKSLGTSDECLHRFPSGAENFIGRKEELKEIESKESKRPILINLFGKTGVGRKAMAFKIADRHKFQFRDAQLYYDMKADAPTSRSATDVISYIIQSFQPDVDIPSSKLELVKLYRNLTRGKRFILVLDNVDNGKIIKPLISSKNMVFIIVSEFSLELSDWITHQVDEMLKDDAIVLLNSICPQLGFSHIVFSKSCKNHPFTMVLAARFVKSHPGVDTMEFLNKMSEEVRHLEFIDTESFDRSATAMLNLCYKLLDDDIAVVLRKLLVFPEAFDASAEAFVCEDSGNTSLALLASFGFLEFDSKNDVYFLEEFVRSFLRSKIQGGERSMAEMRMATYYLTRLVEASELFSSGGAGRVNGMILFDKEWDGIKAGWEWTQKNQSDEASRLCCSYMEAAGEMLRKRQPLKLVAEWLDAAISASRKVGEEELEKNLMFQQGEILFEQKKLKNACAILLKVLELSKKQKDMKMELASMRMLGLANLELGNLAEAKSYFQNELDYLKATQSTDGIEVVYENLGRCAQFVEDYEGALKMYGQGLTFAQKNNNVHQQGVVFRRMGEINIAQKNAKMAVNFLEQSLIFSRKTKSKKEQGLTLFQLGKATNLAKSFDKAIGFYQQALTMARQTNDIKLEGETIWALSLTLRQKGDGADALRQGKAALKIFEVIKHPMREEAMLRLKEWRVAEGEVF